MKKAIASSIVSAADVTASRYAVRMASSMPGPCEIDLSLSGGTEGWQRAGGRGKMKNGK